MYQKFEKIHNFQNLFFFPDCLAIAPAYPLHLKSDLAFTGFFITLRPEIKWIPAYSRDSLIYSEQQGRIFIKILNITVEK